MHPIPTNFRPVRHFDLASPGVDLFPYFPAVLTDSAGVTIDLRTRIPGFPFANLVLLSEDHGTSPGGLFAYWFADDPADLISHDDAIAKGLFDAWPQMPQSNPFIRLDSIPSSENASAQLETAEMVIHPKTGDWLVYGHCHNILPQQIDYAWRINWQTLAVEYFGRRLAGVLAPDHHGGYARALVVGDELVTLALDVGGSGSTWKLAEDVQGTGIDQEIARTWTEGWAAIGDRHIGLSGMQLLLRDGKIYGIAGRKEIGTSGTQVGYAELVLFPIRDEAATRLADRIQAISGPPVTLLRPDMVAGDLDGNGYATGYYFEHRGRSYMYGVARQSDASDNNLILFEGAQAPTEGGVMGEISERFGASLLAWPRVTYNGDLPATDGLHHGTLNGSPTVVPGLIPGDDTSAIEFTGAADQYASLGDFGVNEVLNGGVAVTLLFQTTETDIQRFGMYQPGTAGAFSIALNAPGPGQMTLFLRSFDGLQSFTVRDTSDGGWTDGEPHVLTLVIFRRSGACKFYIDKKSRPLTETTIGEIDRSKDVLGEARLGVLPEYLDQPLIGTYQLPIILRQPLTPAEVAWLHDRLLNGARGDLISRRVTPGTLSLASDVATPADVEAAVAPTQTSLGKLEDRLPEEAFGLVPSVSGADVLLQPAPGRLAGSYQIGVVRLTPTAGVYDFAAGQYADSPTIANSLATAGAFGSPLGQTGNSIRIAGSTFFSADGTYRVLWSSGAANQTGVPQPGERPYDAIQAIDVTVANGVIAASLPGPTVVSGSGADDDLGAGIAQVSALVEQKLPELGFGLHPVLDIANDRLDLVPGPGRVSTDYQMGVQRDVGNGVELWRWSEEDYEPPVSPAENLTNSAPGNTIRFNLSGFFATDGDYAIHWSSGKAEATAIGYEVLQSINLTVSGGVVTLDPWQASVLAAGPVQALLASDIESIEAGGGATVDAEQVPDSRTWRTIGSRAPNYIEVQSGFAGTLAMDFTNELDGAIAGTPTVAMTGPVVVAPTNVRLMANKRGVLFDAPALSTAGTYTAKVTATTVDSQTLPAEGTLVVE